MGMAANLLTVVGFQFSSSGLEKRYSDARTAAFVKFDWCFIVIYGSFWANLGIRGLQTTGLTVSKLCCWFHLIAILCYCWVLLQRSGSRCRTVIVIIYRGLILPLTSAFLFPTYFPDPVTDFTSFFRWAFQATSIINTAASPVMMPVLVKYQLLIQAVSLWFKTRVNTPNACHIVGQTSVGLELVAQTWSAIERAAWRVLNIVYLTNFEGRSVPEPHSACGQLLGWLYLMLCLVLPLYCLWVAEYMSRVQYLKAYPRDDAAVEELRYWPPLRWIGYHAVCVVFFAAIAWEGLSGRSHAPSLNALSSGPSVKMTTHNLVVA